MAGDEEHDPQARAALLAALADIGSIDLDTVAVTSARASRPGGADRPALIDVDTAASHVQTKVTVELRHRGHRARITATAGTEEHVVLLAVARATATAVTELLPPGTAELHVDWVHVIEPPTPHRPAVLHCSAVLRTAGGHEILAGSAVVRHTRYHSMARALLDAVNRRFAQLVAGSPPD
jgi:hypothetical protein